jgi:hypothetical protein
MGALPAWPMPISGCDLREVSLPDPLRLLTSSTPQPSSAKWQLAHAVLPEAEICGEKNSSRPNSISAGLSTGRGAGRRYSRFIAASSAGDALRLEPRRRRRTRASRPGRKSSARGQCGAQVASKPPLCQRVSRALRRGALLRIFEHAGVCGGCLLPLPSRILRADARRVYRTGAAPRCGWARSACLEPLPGTLPPASRKARARHRASLELRTA